MKPLVSSAIGVLVAIALLYVLLRIFGPAFFTLTVWALIVLAAFGVTRLARTRR